MKSNVVALVEIGGSHDECLLTQISALKTAGKKIFLVTFQEVFERNDAFDSYVDETFFVDMSGSKSERGKEVSRIWKKLKAENCERVVLNTAEGNLVRLLCVKALFNKMEFVGIVHNTRKFEKSFTQSIINKKIKKYLMLSDNLVKSITPPKGCTVDYFYPIKFDSVPNKQSTATKTVVIIGGVERRRKDLDGFVELAKQTVTENVQYIFLGKSNFELEEVKEFHQELEKAGLNEVVQTYNEFVPQHIFDETVQNADLILPLVHPDTQSAEEYFKLRMSGAMCVSFGYKVPMLLHEHYSHITEMQAASFYYRFENFSETLTNALSESVKKQDDMKKHEPYSVAYQEKKYINFVLS